jgi:HD-GYP domain-containing protein (c-di-GMP phosphodiesterase class II)
MTILNAILLVGALGLFVLVLELVRRRSLREEYSLLWLLTSGAYLILALWPNSAVMVTRFLGLSSPENFIILIGINLLFVILIQFTIRLSKLTNRYKDIAQQLSIIDHELSITAMDTDHMKGSSKAYFYILAASIAAREKYTNIDIDRKVRLIQILSRYLNWSPKEQEALEFAAILHDIGKITIPLSMLYKSSKLDDAEWEMIKVHPLTSVSIIEGIPFLFASVPMIRHHHEHWDGSGYPEGLLGEKIPEGARILGVVQALVALLADRPYRKALPLEKALKIIDEQSGKKYDPKIIDTLHACWDEITYQLQPQFSTPEKKPQFNLFPERNTEVSSQPIFSKDGSPEDHIE